MASTRPSALPCLGPLGTHLVPLYVLVSESPWGALPPTVRYVGSRMCERRQGKDFCMPTCTQVSVTSLPPPNFGTFSYRWFHPP